MNKINKNTEAPDVLISNVGGFYYETIRRKRKSGRR